MVNRVPGHAAPDPAPCRVCDMPLRLRPREAVARQGLENVSDAVLLALILRTGARGTNVMDLAEALLVKYGSLTALSRVSVDAMAADTAFKGLGRVKAQMVRAALELARRMADETRDERGGFVRTPDEAAELMREVARGLDHERFWVLTLDTRNRLKGRPVEISRGILDSSLVHPREVFKAAIQAGSAAVVLVHNHPSGDPSPSAEDIKLTRQLVQTGQVVGIKVLDHVILGRRTGNAGCEYTSLRQSGTVGFDG